MYLTITAYDLMSKLVVRVVGVDTVENDEAEAMKIGFRANTEVSLPTDASWADVVALAAEAALDIAYDRP